MLVFTCSLASVSKCWNTSLCYVYQRAGRILAEEPLTSLSHHIGHPSSSAVPLGQVCVCVAHYARAAVESMERSNWLEVDGWSLAGGSASNNKRPNFAMTRDG
ncbi:hypothetical protein V9T40_003801 [Parthenolecanium corni]|uniref:Uncharacterized protein n=1 Tax=Parthenolecanium corni TaxID=536013 RepID=A0AAN9TRZ4_9HEMI